MNDIQEARGCLRAAEVRMRSRGDTEGAAAWVAIANGWLRAAEVDTEGKAE